MTKRTIKAIIKNTTLLAALLFTSCTIGLGAAVDTAAPTVEISYPPKNAVIRQSFVAAGLCDDDLEIDKVEVTLTETTSKKVYGPYPASLNEEKTNWQLTLNQQSSAEYNDFEAYKQWELPDGNYIVSVISYDKKKNASQESSVPVSIDNTPPVLLVSKPLAVGTENASVYGRTLNIVGDISEEHETAKLTLFYKEYDPANPASFDAAPTKSLEIKGFGTMSSDNPLTIARLLEGENQDADENVLSQNYKKIYGQEQIDITQSNKKLFYCGFLLEDNAKVYQTPGDTGLEEGNLSTHYYILSDDFNENLFSENTYSLNARNLMLLLSGRSSYSQIQVSQITNLLQKSGNSALSKTITPTESTKFSIDPKNNPLWSITGFDITNGDFTTYELGSAVPLVLEAGGDGIAVDKKTIQVELYHLGATPQALTGSTPHITLIQKGTYEDGKLKESLQQDDSFYDFGNGDIGLKVNHYYEIVVTGSDVDGNELDSKEGRYGFKRYSTFAPPTITFLAGPEEPQNLVENNFKSGTTLDAANGVNIFVKVVTASKDISIEGSDKITINSITADNTPISKDNYTYIINDWQSQTQGDAKIYTFTANIKAKTGKSLVLGQGTYKYKVSFTAEDSLSGGKNESHDFEFKVDNAKPTISGITLSPRVNKTVNGQSIAYVNGEITVSGNVSDSGSGLLNTIKYGIDTANSSASGVQTVAVNGTSWSFPYNTLDKTTTSGNCKLYIYVQDLVGNEETQEVTLNIDQDTDTPVINFTNAGNTFTKASNILIGNVTDDDGLRSVEAWYTKTAPVAGSKTKFNLTGFTEGLTSYSINAKLPDEEGEYLIEVVAKDKPGLNKGTNTYTPFTVKKDEGAPVLTVTSPNTNSQTYYPGSLTVKGNVKDGSGKIKTITRTVARKNSTTNISSLTKDIDITSLTDFSAIVDGTAAWQDTITFSSALGSGTYEVTYEATDKYDNKFTLPPLTFLIDVNAPEIINPAIDGKVISSSSSTWSNKSDVKLTVKALEAKTGDSGVEAVQYDRGDGNWKNMVYNETSHEWEADISFATSANNTLRIKAKDKAGNFSTPKVYTLKIDTKSPVITVTPDNPASLTGNIYVNKKQDVSFTVKIDDVDSGFATSPVEIQIGSTGFTNEATVTSGATDNSKTYNVTIPKTSLVDGLLKITSTDSAGNQTEKEVCTFIVDTTPPTIEHLTLEMKKNTTTLSAYKDADDKYYIRNTTDGKLSISGISTEINEFKQIQLQITATGATTITQTKTASPWTFDDIDLSATAWTTAGKASVTLTAKDGIGNESEKSFEIVFDETVPMIVKGYGPDTRYYFRGEDVYKYNNLLMGDNGEGRYSEFSYGRASATKFTVYLKDATEETATTEGSGIKKFEYKLWASDKETKTEAELKTAFDNPAFKDWSSSGSFVLESGVPYSYYDSAAANPGPVDRTGTKAVANISGFKPTTEYKINYLLLRPIDNCGNAGEFEILKIKIDQTAPVVTANPVDKLTNGTTPITIQGDVTDADAGLKALHVYIDDTEVLTIGKEDTETDDSGNYKKTNDYGTISYTADHLLRDAPDSAHWTLTLTPDQGDWFSQFAADANPVVKIQAEDWAELNSVGNMAPTPTKVAVIKKDIVPPTVTITSPDNNSTVNGTYTINGTSSDTGSNPAKLAVYYSKASDKPTAISSYTKLTEKIVGQDDVTLSQLLNFSFDVDFFDSNLIGAASTQEKQAVWILIAATDEAGNESEIKTDNTFKYTIDRNQDRPTVTISDKSLSGMSSSDYKKVIFSESTVYINVSDDDGIKKLEYRTTPKNEAAGTWKEITNLNNPSITLSSQGEQTIEFKITDNENGVFESGASKQWNKIILEDSDRNKYGDTSTDSTNTNAVIYATLDTTPPDLTVKGIKAPGDTNFIPLNNFTKTLGGSTTSLTLQVEASDSGSGIKEVRATTTVQGTDDVVETVTTPSSANTYEIPVSCNKDRFGGTGVLKLTITAVDNAGRERSSEKTFNIDNEEPAITVSTPQRNSEQSGSLPVSGYFTESVKFSYAISPIDISPDAYKEDTTFNFIKNGDTANKVNLPAKDKANATILPQGVENETGTTDAQKYLSYVKKLCSYTDYSDQYVSSFNLYLDGSETSSAHSALLNTWLTKIGITTTTDLGANTNSFDDIVTLYLHLKAVDDAGNEYHDAYPILVDPQGNRPKVEFSYPSVQMGESPVLGGTINIIGSATGKNQVTKVYMQIDTDNDGDWDQDDIDYIDKADNNNNTTNNKYFNSPIAAIPGLTNQKGIEITVNGTSWSQRININGEFNPTQAQQNNNQTRPINIRLYAVDNQGTRSSPKTKTIQIDNDVPVIGQNLLLVQWADGKNAGNGFDVENDQLKFDSNGNIVFASDAYTALREYRDGMYVNGKWYLVGTVTDDGGISKINIDGSQDTESSTTLIGQTIAADGTLVRQYTVNGKNNYLFCLPIGSDTGVGQSSIPFYAKDNGKSSVSKTFSVNYDNTPPVVSPITEDQKKILNNNGYYKLSSIAAENPGANGANQSGIERIAFFFTRNTSADPTTVFDPMIKSDATGNKVTYTGTLDSQLEDGLFWQTATVSSVNGSTLTMAAATDFTNIHQGGLAKVNGSIYRIQIVDATGKTVTLSGTPGTTSSAKFAIANVIDSTSPEDVPDSNIQTGTADYGYGYAAIDADNRPWDDGDLMPERCITTGTQCNWEANINSKNISDGPVTLHYVVFDKAGNYTSLTAECVVQNNSPRLAGAYIGTDENGNGSVDWSNTTINGYNGEYKAYHQLFKNGYNGVNKVTELMIPSVPAEGNRASAITVKRNLAIKPEIIGGIGALGYTYKVGTYSNSITSLGVDGNGDTNNLIDLGNNKIEITVNDFITNNIADGEKDFIFTIWDSTPGLTQGTNSQSASLNVRLNIALDDRTGAQNTILPFYWKDKEHNSLKDNNPALGHIELSKDLPEETFKSTNSTATIYTLNPKISGAIKLEGIAQDNSLLKELSGIIRGTSYTIASYSNGTWDCKSGTGWEAKDMQQATYYELYKAGYITGARYNELTAEGTGIKGTDLVPYASQEFGHVVHWTMEIDTQAMSLTPAAGIQISVSAADKGSPYKGTGTQEDPRVPNIVNDNAVYTANGFSAVSGQTGGNDGSGSYTSQYKVDLVPYITRIQTALSAKSKKEDTSEYDRTSLGHYPVRRWKEDNTTKTETIIISGFNLDGTVKFISKDDDPAEAPYAVAGVTIPDNAKSGEIYIINGVESLNNKNNNNAKGSYNGVIPTDASKLGDEETYNIFTNCYNRKPNTANNYILTDDVILDVWEFNSEAAKPNKSGVISDPIMKINPNNDLIGFAYQSGPTGFSMANQNNSYQFWVGDYDNLSATGFAYDSGGNTYGTALGGDINSSPNVSKFVFLTSLWGTSGGYRTTAGGGTNAMRFEQIGQLGTKTNINNTQYIDKFRFVSPSIAVSGSGNNANIYLAYYDKMNQEIRFKWASKPTNDKNFSGKKYIDDRYTSGNLGSNDPVNNHRNESVDPDNYCLLDFQIIAENITGTTTSLGKPGPYVALDVIPNGTTVDGTALTNDIVVLVWYDEANQNLMYTYNKLDLSTVAENAFEGSANTKNHWQTPSTIFTGAGQYCQVKTDIAGGVHIAAYDSLAGDVRYAKLTSYKVTPDGANGTTKYDEDTMSCVVDASGIVGSNLTLDVAYSDTVANGGKAIPHIGYYGSIGPKMARLTVEGAALSTTAAAAGTVKDMFTGYWDVTEIPTPSNAPKDRVNVGVWKDNNGVIKNSSNGNGVSTHANNGTESGSGTTKGNGTKNPVVAYEIRPSSAHGYMETAQMK